MGSLSVCLSVCLCLSLSLHRLFVSSSFYLLFFCSQAEIKLSVHRLSQSFLFSPIFFRFMLSQSRSVYRFRVFLFTASVPARVLQFTSSVQPLFSVHRRSPSESFC